MGQVSLFQHGSSARKTLDFSSTGSLSPFISIVIKPPKGKDQISNDRRNRLNGIIISASIEKAENVSVLSPVVGRSGEARTHGLCVPNTARYHLRHTPSTCLL